MRQSFMEYLSEKTDKFIKKMSRRITRRLGDYYGSEISIIDGVETVLDIKKKELNPIEVKTSELKTGDMMIMAAVDKRVNVTVDLEETKKAEWVDVDDATPQIEGFYMVLTDDHLTKGIAFYGPTDDGSSDSDYQMGWEVWWAMSGPADGSAPGVKYWLKDNHWGLVYDFKKKAGEIR